MNKELFYERKFSNNPMFPFNIFFSRKLGNEAILDCHWHNELEFFIVSEGNVLFQVDTNYYELGKGQAVFINSGEIHACHRIDDKPCSFSAIIFNPTFIFSNFYDVIQHEYFEPIISKSHTLPTMINGEVKWEEKVLSLLSEILHMYHSQPFGFELSIKANLYQIFFEIIFANKFLQNKKSTSKNAHKAEKIKTVLNYIEANYSNKISISDLAEQIGLSDGHFQRFFKDVVKKTPIEYLNNYRINIASRLLVNSDKKIIAIAMETGFESCSYFTGNFKQYMKCTPSQYRNRQKDISEEMELVPLTNNNISEISGKRQ